MRAHAVRTALRSRAERARGFAASSRSDGETGLATRSKVGSSGRRSAGRWREPAGVPPLRSRRKRLTIRSSRLWKVTTASRPPGFSARSAAARPCFELVELGVQMDADRLEGAGRGIALLARAEAGGAADDRGQLGGALDRPGGDDGAGDRPGARLLPIVAQDPGDLGLVGRD